MKVLVLFAVLLLVSCSAQPVQENLNTQQTTVSVIEPEPNARPQEPTSVGKLREFSMTATDFQFTPATINVNKGDMVRLKITSGDVRHGIAIQGYKIRKELPVNQEVVIEFVADNEGEFPFYCSVFCGSGHGAMHGLLVVS